MAIDYKQQIDRKYNLQVQEILKDFPSYIKDFFNHIHNTASRTRLSYVYNIRNFYNWLLETNLELQNKSYKDITLDVLSCLEVSDIDEYLAYMTTINASAGIAQKSASLNALFKYLFDNKKIAHNPVAGIKRRKVDVQPIIKLNEEQMEKFLDTVAYGSDKMTAHQEAFWKRDRIRDMAIICILLTTGIRVSECVGLDLDDVDLKECKLMIIRKGHKEKQFVFFSDEAKDALVDYLSERNLVTPNKNASEALFLSAKGNRISVDAIEKLVKKYAVYAGIGTKITPHKLRKTYGTELYNQTGDIYLVASVLGQTDVATTVKHYVESSEERQRLHRNTVTLNKNHKKNT